MFSVMSALIKMQYLLSKQTNQITEYSKYDNQIIANVTIGKNAINLQFCLKNTIMKMYPYFL